MSHSLVAVGTERSNFGISALENCLPHSLWAVTSGPVWSIALSPDGQILASVLVAFLQLKFGTRKRWGTPLDSWAFRPLLGLLP